MQEDTVTENPVMERPRSEYERYKALREAWRAKRRQEILDEVTAHRQPGILDRIQACESHSAAHLMWHEFLDSANAVSQKTINKANRLLETLDFPEV